jgi:hypothetical protein
MASPRYTHSAKFYYGFHLARFAHALPQPFLSGSKGLRAFVTTLPCHLVDNHTWLETYSGCKLGRLAVDTTGHEG